MNNKLTSCLLLFLLAASRHLAAQPQPGDVLWTYQASGTIRSSPALAADGTIYLDANSILNAITNSGATASNRWSSPASGAPAIGADGTIYSVSGGLYAVTPTGSQNWFYPVVGANSHPAIGLDDTVYFVAEGRLYAIAPSGTKRWDILIEYDSPYWFAVQSPVIGADGTIYVGVADALYALTREGTNKWSATLNFFGNDSPAIGANGVVYTSAQGLYAFGVSGTNLWFTPIVGNSASPGVGTDGTLYVAGTARRLRAVTPAGELTWQALNGPQYGTATTPAIDAGGRIYYCISNTVWALNPQGQVQWSITTPNIPDPRIDVASTSPIIGPDGTLYAALGTTLYSIATGTNGPANSPWPMYRQNARHTGKVEKPALQQPRKRADANFEFQLYAQLGQTNTVEITTNFNVWTSLTSIVVTTVPMEVVDLTASNAPVRFYRSTAP